MAAKNIQAGTPIPSRKWLQVLSCIPPLNKGVIHTPYLNSLYIYITPELAEKFL